MMNDEDWDALLPPIRAGAAFEEILRDLIAELREAHHARSYALTKGDYCPVCQARASRPGEADWPCDTARMADRAEERLREVQGE